MMPDLLQLAKWMDRFAGEIQNTNKNKKKEILFDKCTNKLMAVG